MTVSPDARTPSASVHALSGSTPPGAVVQPFGVSTAGVHEMPDTFAPLGTPAAGVVAALEARRAAVSHPDAKVIHLAERVAALAPVSLVAEARLAQRIDAIDAKLPALPPTPQPENRTKIDNRSVEGWYIATFSYPTTPDEAHDAAMTAYNAEVAEAKRVKAALKERHRIPQWEALERRTSRRLIRRAWRLTYMRPRTQEGLKAKAAAAVAVMRTGASDVWANELHASISRDALRLIGAEAEARAEADRLADGELLALGRAWDSAHRLLDEASDRENRAHARYAATKPDVPEELLVRDTDHRLVGPYVSAHAETGRPWYGAPNTIEMLREGCPAALESGRRQEILDANDQWLAALREASSVCGLNAIADEVDMLAAREFELRGAIVSTPALTHDGVLVKTRVAFSLGAAWDEALVCKIEEGVKNDAISAELLALSIVLDLTRMSRGAMATPAPTADLASAA